MTFAIDADHGIIGNRDHAALRMSERVGFQREGVLRRYWEVDGERLDVVMLARLRMGAV